MKGARLEIKMARKNRDSFGKKKKKKEKERGGGKSERMGRDGKLTRSLLLGALGAENKEREKEKEKVASHP